MIKRSPLAKLLCLIILFFSLSNNQVIAQDNDALRLAFGSCADQRNGQAIWNKIAQHDPDLFIFMGDNVYIDSADRNEMIHAYQIFSNERHFLEFRKNVPIIATWDDHDYGVYDGGKEFAGKSHAKKSFIDFFDYPEINEVAQKEQGIYHTRWLNFKNKKIQIILLDTRWYRDALVRSYLTEAQRSVLKLGPYQPDLVRSSTLLGKQQWAWLVSEFEKPADLRILVSSIQVLAEFSGWETWSNFPHERERLLNLIHQHNGNHTVILSGDAHRAEISALQYKGQNILEITSSGLAVETYPAGINIHRLGPAYEKKNYGLLTIEESGKLTVVANIFSADGDKALTAKLGE